MKTLNKTAFLAIVSISATLAACSNDSDSSVNKVCGTGYESCGSTCCTTGCCDDNVCHDSDSSACGAEKIACASDQICVKGECTDINSGTTCSAQQTNCDGTCVMLSSDINHCGDCATACKPGETCNDGTCTKNCSNGYTLINGQCYDTNSDSEHCGTDNIACPQNTACVRGTCSCIRNYFDCDNDMTNGCESLFCATDCPVNQIKCAENGECIDLITSKENCGKCGNACNENESCVLGSCASDEPQIQCNPEETLCFDKCYNLQSDNTHCGNCLTVCGSNEKCIEGKCELDCGSLDKCDGTCVDTKTSAKHCGACNSACAANQECVGGSCQCAAGYIDCDHDLTDKDGKPNPSTNGCESIGDACSCQPGKTQYCWRGDEKNVKRDKDGNLVSAKGICELGKQTCDGSGKYWGPCEGGKYPSALSCSLEGILNGKDNDCDGQIDTICRSECDLAAGDMSYIGCEYWGAYLDNLITSKDSNFTFVFSNPGEKEATIYIYDYHQIDNASANPVKTLKLAAHQVSTVQLSATAYNMSKGSGIYNNAYRIRSTQPITAYQFSPFGSAAAHSNDASLLLPANVLGQKYIGMTWHSDTNNDHRSYIAVIATQPGTTKVTVNSTATISATDSADVYTPTGTSTKQTAIENLSANTDKTYTLKRFDVLTLMAPANPAENQTGTTIEADQNIAVFGGSRASYVPSQAVAKCCRDHIEEQLFPTQAWGKNYYAARAYSTGKAGDFWLITAREDNTTVTLPSNLKTRDGSKVDDEFKATIGGVIKLNAGQTYPAFETRDSFEIKADKPISVGQFTPSQQYNGLSIGDPSFITTVPVEQYRSDYDFVVSSAFDVDYLTIVAPKTASITLDGKKLETTDFISVVPIVNTEFTVYYYQIAAGVHHMNATAPFGLYSYGYFNMSSYGYPIGLDLKILNTN